MKDKFPIFHNIFIRVSRLGLDEEAPYEEMRIIMIHNSLNFLSTIFLSPFPLLFYFLDLPQGYTLCFISLFAIGIQFLLNSLKLPFLARFLGITLGLLGFLIGLLFFGFNAGFAYGFMALLPLPILFFRSFFHRMGAIVFNSLLIIFTIYYFYEEIPFYPVLPDASLLNWSLMFFSTLLVISYFISSDWINQMYRGQNANLVEQLMIRNEELKNFSYSTSHDLKQPLQTILSFVSLFQNKKSDRLDEEGLVYLNFIQEAGTRLNQLVDALLAHSILGQIQNFESVDSRSLVEEVVFDLKAAIHAQNGEITLGGLPTLVANRQELGAVFQNLITNALKFRKAEESPLISIWAEDQGTHWKFIVKDNGQGIEPYLEDKIFQMFQKGHNDSAINGTGIGLANCKKIINLHGGEIWVESQLGYGSRFHFTVKKIKAPN